MNLMENRTHNTPGVNRVIRHQGTQAFFAAGGWTVDFNAAQKFRDVLSILKTQQRYKLRNVEFVLVLMGEPSSFDIALPLS
jgi:hypothetical protein